jgi:LacI family transcriptional regulator
VVNLIDALAERGVRVPEDVALIVIDKDPQRTAELAPVPLTGVVPDFWQQGYQAAALLDHMIDHPKPHHRILRVPPVGLVRRESTGIASSRDPVVKKVLHLLEGQIGQHLGVAELARLTGVSRRTLETRFRRETGKTLHEARIQRQMDKAKRLLRNPGRTVAETAHECGFSSVHYFTTAFKRELGVTPGAYRKRR